VTHFASQAVPLDAPGVKCVRKKIDAVLQLNKLNKNKKLNPQKRNITLFKKHTHKGGAIYSSELAT